jgi:hypothetical protein
MKLREAIRTIVQEVVGSDLRKIVREILVEELMDSNGAGSTRSMAAKKAAVTRAANRARSGPAASVASGQESVPRAARKLGLARGQRYKGKDYLPQIKDRVITIAKLTDKGVLPEILEPKGKRVQAKIIGYDSFLKRYDRIE